MNIACATRCNSPEPLLPCPAPPRSTWAPAACSRHQPGRRHRRFNPLPGRHAARGRHHHRCQRQRRTHGGDRLRYSIFPQRLRRLDRDAPSRSSAALKACALRRRPPTSTSTAAAASPAQGRRHGVGVCRRPTAADQTRPAGAAWPGQGGNYPTTVSGHTQGRTATCPRNRRAPSAARLTACDVAHTARGTSPTPSPAGC
jgi:hypothetical protein